MRADGRRTLKPETCNLAVEGGEEHSSSVKLVDTGLTFTKYVPQLLAAFDVDCADFDPTTADCNHGYLTLQQSV